MGVKRPETEIFWHPDRSKLWDFKAAVSKLASHWGLPDQRGPKTARKPRAYPLGHQGEEGRRKGGKGPEIVGRGGGRRGEGLLGERKGKIDLSWI